MSHLINGNVLCYSAWVALVHYKRVSHLAIPNDFQKESLEARIEPMNGRIPDFRIVNAELVESAVRLIEEAERPVIIAGWGAKEQGANLIKPAERINSPTVTTFRAKGEGGNHNLKCTRVKKGGS